MKKIIIHYPFIPNYRVPVFNEISNNKDIDLIVMSASKSNDETLLSKKNNWNFKHILTRVITFKLFKKVFDIEYGVLINLIKLRKSFDYYVILSNPNILSSWLYSIFAKTLGYTVIFWGHGLLKQDKGIKKYLRKCYYKIPDKFWLYGNEAKYLMVSNGINSNKIKVIYNSLDYEVQKKFFNSKINNREDIRKSFSFDRNDFVMICIGRLLPKLEIDKIIKEIKEIKEINIKLIIIGSGPIEDELKKIVFDNKITENVIFTGSIYEEDIISNYYIAADISVVMGVVGLAAMHSLAYGVPMITHSSISEHCPEVEAIIDGETGYFFDKDKDKDFYNKIIDIARNNKILRDKCISKIEYNYTPKKQVNYIIESINER